MFTYPRLHHAFTSADIVMVVKQAIAGELLEVDVPYYKYIHSNSISHSQLHNATVLSIDDSMLGNVDLYTKKFNLAHSHVASSHQLAQQLAEGLSKNVNRYLVARGLKKKNRNQIIQNATALFWDRIRTTRRVAVLGAGIQGCLMALLFRKHGFDVTLIDKSSDIMTRTSATGEGRIHMGLEYANDPSMRTAAYMLESALRFSSYVEYLVGRRGNTLDWSRLKSERLTCLLPHASHVTPEQFEQYGEKLRRMYEQILVNDPELSYLGERPPQVLLGRTEVPKAVNASYINAAYESIEVCVLSDKLGDILREALYEQSVNMVFNRTVLDVKRNPVPAPNSANQYLSRLRVVSNVGEHDYDAVVNCLWEGRAEIDRKMGLNNR